MDKTAGSIVKAKITYFFKETFRAHSKAEYREIFSRGLNEDNSGVTGAFPWLYVRAFFALLILFTINVVILRVSESSLFVPSVTFLGGITFTVPFIILLYELYPKREISLFLLIAVLVGGGTLSVVLSQIGYMLIPVNSKVALAVVAGILEEVSKAITAIIAKAIFKQKNRYACFLIAAAVGAGFSIIEDMGYIFYYSNLNTVDYSSDTVAILTLFTDRGLSSFCTHVLWTGAIGWSLSLMKRPLRSVGVLIFLSSIALHICWDLPLEGWLEGLDIILCVIIAAAINISIVHKARINTLAEEVDLTNLNEQIIAQAKQMGELMRFRNAGNLTFALTCTFLSVIILVLCAMPIGMDYKTRDYESVEEFIAYVQGGYNLKADMDRALVEEDSYYMEHLEDDKITYVVQKVYHDGYDGIYLYEYYMSYPSKPYRISVELDDGGIFFVIPCTEFKFGNKKVWAFEINSLRGYKYNETNGTVTAVTDAEEFEGYELLIALCAAAFAIAAGCAVILISFKIKLGRLNNEK